MTRTDKKPEETAEFLEFYKLYPRKESRLDALKAFHQVTRGMGIDPTDIIAGVTKYSQRIYSEQTERKFVALPASWLRAGRWADQAYEVPQKKTDGSLPEAKMGRYTGEDENQRWELWKQIRSSVVALKAAEEGWAWDLKCKIMDGSIKSIGEINPAQFQSSKRKTEFNHDLAETDGMLKNWVTGKTTKLSESILNSYLRGRIDILTHEEDTEEEIRISNHELPRPELTGRPYKTYDPIDHLAE